MSRMDDLLRKAGGRGADRSEGARGHGHGTGKAVLQASGLTKSFRGRVAVDQVDLDIASGETFGLLGPNGAGKTTIMRLCLGLLRPHAGAVRLFGVRPNRLSLKRVGYMPEECGLSVDLTVSGTLQFLGRLKGMTARAAERESLTLLERIGLHAHKDKPVKDLSRGMTQLAQFAAAVQHNPALLILDEPFSGLDPMNVRLMKDVLGECKQRGATVVFSTHILPDVEEMCERVALIDDGHVSALRGPTGNQAPAAGS